MSPLSVEKMKSLLKALVARERELKELTKSTINGDMT